MKGNLRIFINEYSGPVIIKFGVNGGKDLGDYLGEGKDWKFTTVPKKI